MSDLSQIYAKKPPHTDEELAIIITAERAARAQFALGATAKREKKAKSPVDLGELDI